MRISALALAPASLLLLCVPGFSTQITTSYTGTFTDANSVFTTSFTLDSASHVVLQTYGYGGSASAPNGANNAGAVIDAGGFDPVIYLFDGSGNWLAENDDATATLNDFAACLPGTPDAKGHCLDARLTVDLNPGTYQIALTAFHNDMTTTSLLGGWNDNGTFNDRLNSYALDLTATTLGSQSAVPEPGSGILLLPIAGLGIVWHRRRGKA